MRTLYPFFPPAPIFSLISILAGCFFTVGCARSTRTVVEAPPPTYQAPPTTTTQPADMPKLPAKINEVREAVTRVFKDAASIDDSRQPNFVAGDFNGDQSQDIAVIIKPTSAKIDDMNQEYPPWILKDPFAPHRLLSSGLHVAPDEVLLAVIHGYGANDWRDPQATQTFLLKNAAGSNMEVHIGKDFVAANVGRRIPRTQGDLIKEMVRGSSGYLYYSGPTYSWYDPKTFKGGPEIKVVHPGTAPSSSK